LRQILPEGKPAAQKRFIGSLISPMKINHLNLCVPDVPQTGRLFVEFFGLQLTEEKGRAVTDRPSLSSRGPGGWQPCITVCRP